MKELHEQIKAIRKAKGLTQEKVAEALEIKKANLSRIENGAIKLSHSKLMVLAKLFGMTIEEIASFESIDDKVKKEKQKGRLEELLDQKVKQIERMQRNTEEFITELFAFFQKEEKEGNLNTLHGSKKVKVTSAFDALCEVEGIKHLFNEDNLRKDFPLLEPFNEFRRIHLDLNWDIVLEQLRIIQEFEDNEDKKNNNKRNKP